MPGEQNQDGTRGDGRSQLGLVLHNRSALQRELRIIGGVKRRRLGSLLRALLALSERTLERLLDGGNLHHRGGWCNGKKLRVTRRRAHGRGAPGRGTAANVGCNRGIGFSAIREVFPFEITLTV